MPYENNLYYVPENGSPLLSAFTCRPQKGNSTCLVAISKTADLNEQSGAIVAVPEYTLCSNRGICDFDNGICKCFIGYENSNCDTYTTVLRESTRAIDETVFELELSADSKAYTANILGMRNLYGRKEGLDLKGYNTKFNWMKMEDPYKVSRGVTYPLYTPLTHPIYTLYTLYCTSSDLISL